MTPLEKELLEALEAFVESLTHPESPRYALKINFDDLKRIREQARAAIAHATAPQPAPAIDIARAVVADMEEIEAQP